MIRIHGPSFTAALFSSANFIALGAAALSAGLESMIGAVLYLLALVFGTWNKYQSLTAEEDPAKKNRGPVMRFLCDPSLTAQILMLIALYNGIEASWMAFTDDRSELFFHVTRAAMWYLGVLGDNAIRINDSVNFTRFFHAAQDIHSRLKASVLALIANPAFFYSLLGLPFIMNLMESARAFSLESFVGGWAFLLYGSGVSYAVWRSFLATNNKIGIHDVNDGPSNIFLACGNLSVAVLAGVNAWLTGGGFNPYCCVCFSQIVFACSGLLLIRETRLALHRRGISEQNA